MERSIIMSQITNICQVPFYSQSGAASPQGWRWLRLRQWFAKGQSGTVPTRAWIQEVSSIHRKWTRPSACQQEISNHFSDTKATGISCLSVGEGLWDKVQEVKISTTLIWIWCGCIGSIFILYPISIMLVANRKLLTWIDFEVTLLWSRCVIFSIDCILPLSVSNLIAKHEMQPGNT